MTQTIPEIDGYRIIRRIGQGGMASVYCAFEAMLHREVAIKIVSLSDTADQDLLTRLEFEAMSLARLRHPHIVELYRFGRINAHTLYYVMPLLSGGDLTVWLRPAEESKVRALLSDLLDALGYAHSLGIVHRDVKPENVLFDLQGRAHLADFGAAIDIGANSPESRLTREGFSIGSLGYMSPEQARGLPVTGASDLYSLAVMAFELLTGQRSHRGTDAIAIALAQLERPMEALPSHLSHWQAFFTRALQPEPAQRFETAALMKAALPPPKDWSSLPIKVDSQIPGNTTSTSVITKQVPVAAIAKAPAKFSLFVLGACAALLLVLFASWAWRNHARAERFGALSTELSSIPIAQATLRLRSEKDALNGSQQSELAGIVLRRMESALAPLSATAALSNLSEPWGQMRQWRGEFQLQTSSEFQEVELTLTRRVEETLKLAAEQFDQATAKASLPLARALTSNDAKFLELIARAEKIPSVGDVYVDSSGIQMRLVEAPKGVSKGLAVMANPLSQTEFARFAKAASIEPPLCAGEPDRACMDQEQANAILAWLNQQSRQAFVLPSAAQWQKAYRYAPKREGYFATSSECRLVSYTQRPNVLARTWGGIRTVFGGPGARGKTARYCDGELVFALDGTGANRASVEGKSVLVLLQTIDVSGRGK